MHRVHDVTLFRAAGASMDWLSVVRRRFEQAPDWPGRDEVLERVKRRHDIRLVWSCAAELGVPHRAFTVWQRTISRATLGVDHQTRAVEDGELVTWGGVEAVHVHVVVDVTSGGGPVGLYLLRGGGVRVAGAVAADVQDPGGRSTLTLQARCGSATSAVLVGATVRQVRLTPVEEAVRPDGWEELEHVGLPVRGALRDYSADPQGLVVDLVDPVEAALRRLDRAGPPLGWWPVTESGRLAPPWHPPDPVGLVKETHEFLLPEVERLYAAGLREHDQRLVSDARVVDPPSQDGRTADQPATAGTHPLGTLLVAAGTDPSLCLTLGFGTGYGFDDLANHPAEVELLVTAPYRHSVHGDDVELAAYVPPVSGHAQVPPVVDLVAGRAALLPPATRDAPYRESVEVSWRPRQGLATLTDPVALALAAFGPGDAEATSRLTERPGGGPQLRALAVPDLDPDEPPPPGRERPRLVDPELALPASGPVTRGYAVAQVDLFGVWSRWEDATTTTLAPVVLPPRIGRLELTAEHVSGPVCPSGLVLDVAVDWSERSPERVEVVAAYYPMPSGDMPPPAGLSATSPAPPGGHRQTWTIVFSGDVAAVGAGATVAALAEDGSVASAPGGAEQGEETRSYRVTAQGPALDFGPVSRWGVQAWVQEVAVGVPVASAWSPRPDHPATAVAASPVPAVPVPPPQPPGVPLGSTPDAQGRSHVRVTWGGLASAQVDRVVVWETSETALRQRLGAPAAAPSLLPGWRLQALWDLYEDAPAAARPQPFRRLLEVGRPSPGVPLPTEVDVALPRGTEDLHLFVVTAVTTTGLESAWPAASGATPARAHLQSFMAPRLRRPSTPVVRPEVQDDGSIVVQLRAASPVEVTHFEVFATRSEVAARDHLTMGPPVVGVTATDTGDTDAVTGEPVYGATWSGGLTPSWDPWWVRAVAVPKATVPEEAVRGQVSTASDVVPVSVRPSGPPDLAPLVAEVVGADHRGVLVRTSTTAPDRLVGAGSHRVVVTLAGASASPVALEDLPMVTDDDTSPDVGPGPVVQRMPRPDGRTPLLVWAGRTEPGTPLPVSVRLVDPLGRAAERSLEVPGWVQPQPHLTLRVVDAFRVVGRGWVLDVATSARATERPAYELAVVATTRRALFPRPGALSATFLLPDIPERRRPAPPRATGITASRSDDADGTRVALWLPTTTLYAVHLAVRHPHHGQVQVTWRPPVA